MEFCMVCRAELRVSDLDHPLVRKDKGVMCSHCRRYLVGGKGTNTGTFMYQTVGDMERGRMMHIRPHGFWSDAVNVTERIDTGDFKTYNIDISWSSGGTDGSRSCIEEAINLSSALMFAAAVATAWAKDRRIT